MNLVVGPHGSWPHPERRAAATIGVYDGVHRGHRAIIGALGEQAGERDLALTVVTFRSHPAEVLAPERVPPRLTTLDQQLDQFAALGVDAVAVLDFDDELRRLSAERFVVEVLVEALECAVVSVGEDFRFGYRQEGDVALLRELGTTHGFMVTPMALVGDADGPFRASAIRAALAEGDLGEAGRILGRRFAVAGTVARGDGRGRSIGFPTANLELSPRQALPKRGVYAVWVRLDDGNAPGAANVGVRPTFAGDTEVLEVHLLDSDRDLYDQAMEVEFVARIRDERRFDGVDELAAQIGRDVAEAARLLAVDAGSPT
ncbi:MAG: bifunctional riboflavin kinase/FAD synthetase [Acidimicrobiia bacterium]|nr:bifunctional riboflavin kinase/FAD synthetase [Acidimicrobiia bacterium]